LIGQAGGYVALSCRVPVHNLRSYLLEAADYPLTLRDLKRKHVKSFITDQLDRWKPSTANNRYRGLQAFFKWAVAEDELDANPMSGMEPPKIPKEPPPVLGEDELRRLLKACDGKDFAARRDTAIVRLLLDTGMRRSECATILLELTVVPAELES
jgi:integrase/recombinase XerC